MGSPKEMENMLLAFFGRFQQGRGHKILLTCAMYVIV